MSTPPPDADDLRAVFRRVASSVWVVTTVLDGAPVGFTAISVASVSLTPPLLSFNVNGTSSSLPALRSSRRYAVHLLAGGAEALARRFAGPAAQRFADASAWRWGADGLPELTGTAARAAGHVTDLVPAGDSVVVLGSVQQAAVTALPPLVHHDRTFFSPADFPPADFPPADPPAAGDRGLRACG